MRKKKELRIKNLMNPKNIVNHVGLPSLEVLHEEFIQQWTTRTVVTVYYSKCLISALSLISATLIKRYRGRQVLRYSTTKSGVRGVRMKFITFDKKVQIPSEAV